MKFTKNHNIVNKPLGNWRSIHGHGAAQLVNGRLLLAGYDVSLTLWRDAKYDAIIDANGVPFRIEIKSTGVNQDPAEDESSSISFTSGGRSGTQIDRNAPSREKKISSSDADFGIGVSSHDGCIWVVPVEIIEIFNRKTGDIKLNHSEIFKEKLGIFLGIKGIPFLTTEHIKKGFLSEDYDGLFGNCIKYNIAITNVDKLMWIDHPWNFSKRIQSFNVTKNQSLALDIWEHILNNV
jgi:hypothetical protein